MADPITRYASELDLEHYGLGERSLESLEFPPDAVTAALDAASRVADDYIGNQYDLPLMAVGTSMRMYISWIAAYILLTTNGVATEGGQLDPFRQRYEDAIKWLVRVQNGMRPEGVVGSDSPGVDPGDGGGTGGQSPSARPRIISGSSRGFSSRGETPGAVNDLGGGRGGFVGD